MWGVTDLDQSVAPATLLDSHQLFIDEGGETTPV
jgi:hypothetical protein